VSAKDFLQKLSEAHGVSGYEHAIRDLVIEEFRRLADQNDHERKKGKVRNAPRPFRFSIHR